MKSYRVRRLNGLGGCMANRAQAPAAHGAGMPRWAGQATFGFLSSGGLFDNLHLPFVWAIVWQPSPSFRLDDCLENFGLLSFESVI